MPKRDVTKFNAAIDRVLATTENPRHRYLLQGYSRHRYLEVAGRYEEIFAPDMMVEAPCYHFRAGGISTSTGSGRRRTRASSNSRASKSRSRTISSPTRRRGRARRLHSLSWKESDMNGSGSSLAI